MIFKLFIIIILIIIFSIISFICLFFDFIGTKIKLNLLISVMVIIKKENGEFIKKYIDYFTSIKDIFYLEEIIHLYKILKRKKIKKDKLKNIYGKIFKNFKNEVEILLKIKKLGEIDYCITRFKIIKMKIFF